MTSQISPDLLLQHAPTIAIRLLHSGTDLSVGARSASVLSSAGEVEGGRPRSARILFPSTSGRVEPRLSIRRTLRPLGVQDLVHFLPPLPYRDSLQDGAEADALLLLQAECCDHQVPAKAYEYLRLNKPILALTTHTGDTARCSTKPEAQPLWTSLMKSAIRAALPTFLRSVQSGTHPLPRATDAYSRYSQARRLAECMSAVIAS